MQVNGYGLASLIVKYNDNIPKADGKRVANFINHVSSISPEPKPVVLVVTSHKKDIPTKTISEISGRVKLSMNRPYSVRVLKQPVDVKLGEEVFKCTEVSKFPYGSEYKILDDDTHINRTISATSRGKIVQSEYQDKLGNLYQDYPMSKQIFIAGKNHSVSRVFTDADANFVRYDLSKSIAIFENKTKRIVNKIVEHQDGHFEFI